MPNRLQPWVLALALLATTGCVRETNLEIDVPDAEPYLVVESYLVAGEPYRVSLTRSLPFFATGVDTLPLVADAQVRILHAGDTLPLVYAPIGDQQNYYLFGEYRNQTPVPQSYNTPFSLLIDWRGTRYTARCAMPPALVLQDTTLFFNEDGVNYRFEWEDPDPAAYNVYRSIFAFRQREQNPGEEPEDPEQPIIPSDLQSDDLFVRLGTGGRPNLRFSYTGVLEDMSGDTLDLTVMHIEPAFEDYLVSTQANDNGQANPFAEPGTVLSNITTNDPEARVLGIFTAYDPVKRHYLIP